jgi:hypothetical protein
MGSRFGAAVVNWNVTLGMVFVSKAGCILRWNLTSDLSAVHHCTDGIRTIHAKATVCFLLVFRIEQERNHVGVSVPVGQKAPLECCGSHDAMDMNRMCSRCALTPTRKVVQQRDGTQECDLSDWLTHRQDSRPFKTESTDDQPRPASGRHLDNSLHSLGTASRVLCISFAVLFGPERRPGRNSRDPCAEKRWGYRYVVAMVVAAEPERARIPTSFCEWRRYSRANWTN